ncbi:hypothetical protein IAU59_005658 [Kwoniella sp. CBS 9459]
MQELASLSQRDIREKKKAEDQLRDQKRIIQAKESRIAQATISLGSDRESIANERQTLKTEYQRLAEEYAKLEKDQRKLAEDRASIANLMRDRQSLNEDREKLEKDQKTLEIDRVRKAKQCEAWVEQIRKVRDDCEQRIKLSGETDKRIKEKEAQLETRERSIAAKPDSHLSPATLQILFKKEKEKLDETERRYRARILATSKAEKQYKAKLIAAEERHLRAEEGYKAKLIQAEERHMNAKEGYKADLSAVHERHVKLEEEQARRRTTASATSASGHMPQFGPGITMHQTQSQAEIQLRSLSSTNKQLQRRIEQLESQLKSYAGRTASLNKS